MRSFRLLLAAAGLIGIAGANPPAGNIKVIANSTVKEDRISLRELKSVYLGKSSSLGDGTRVEPVLARNGAAHEAFLRHCLGQSDDQLQTYYRSLVFSGKASMPRQVNSDAEMVAYVARTRNAIGYVSADTDTGGVKILALEGSEERVLIKRVEPAYPEILRNNRIGGVVRLEITIAPNGNVETVKLLGGNPVLAEAAQNAVRKWVYSPSRSRTTMEVSVPFDASR